MCKTNISQFLPEVAKKFTDKQAITFRNKSVTFTQLEQLSNHYACEFRKNGIAKNTKTLVMLKPGIEFIAAVFAIFKIGAIPVLIDPGMGVKNLLNCIKKTKPEAMAGIALAHWVRLLFPGSFKSIKTFFSLGKSSPPWIKKIISIDDFLESSTETDFKIEETDLDDTAAIVFTTGSTGPPKGVVYTHRIYIKQMEIIAEAYGAGPEEIDMPAFPLFALFSAAMGMSCVIPDINPSLPAEVDPEIIINTIKSNEVTFSFASPALWRKVCLYCIEKNIQLPSLKKILMAGAPVPKELHEIIKKTAPNAETMVPYGATEALPVANFAGSEMTEEIAAKISNGEGYCVGKPLPGINIHVISATDEPIGEWDDKLILPQGETGEIVIDGDVVTPEYYNLPEHTKNAKIAIGLGGQARTSDFASSVKSPDTDPDAKNAKIAIGSRGVMHRMGDVGFFDKDGRLWFKGRKAHRVITSDGILYPVCCEAIFNAHSKVYRSALVGVGEPGNKTPVIIIEPVEEVIPLTPTTRQKFIDQLKDLASKKEFTSKISNILFFSPFPVDIRHNAKIFREKLAQWAETRKIF